MKFTKSSIGGLQMTTIPKQIANFRSIINGYKISQIIMTLERYNVFSVIASGTNNLQDIAVKVSVPEDKLAPLLNSVVHYELLSKNGDTYSFTEDSIVLNPTHPASQNGYIHFSENIRDKWIDLSEKLIEDEVSVLDNITGGNIKETRNFISAMHVNAIPQANYIAKNYDFTEHNILDIGAGSGVFSSVIGNQYEDSTGILFDLSGVAPITKEYISDANLGLRFSVESGDYHKGLSEGRFTDVFLFAIIHQESKSNLHELLSKVRTKLKSGGRLFLTSFFLEESRTSPIFPTLFSVEMVVMHESGHVYTFSEIETAIVKAGFTYERVDEMPGPATLYVASLA